MKVGLYVNAIVRAQIIQIDIFNIHLDHQGILAATHIGKFHLENRVYKGLKQVNNYLLFMMDTTNQDQYERLTESLELLSLPFDEQVRYLSEFVDVPLEVMDRFGKALLLLPHLIEAGYFDNFAIASLLRLQNLIIFRSGLPEFKDVDCFRAADAWNKIREMARDALEAMDTTNRYHKKIIESLKFLSLPFDEQVKYLPDFVDVPFEVVDTYDKAISLLPRLIEAGRFDNMAIASLLTLRDSINCICMDPIFKDLDYEQFKTADEWNKIREMARGVLQVLGEPLENPDKKYI